MSNQGNKWDDWAGGKYAYIKIVDLYWPYAMGHRLAHRNSDCGLFIDTNLITCNQVWLGTIDITNQNILPVHESINNEIDGNQNR